MWGSDRPFVRVTVVALALTVLVGVADGLAQSARSIVINARVGAATSLRVSESVLRVSASSGRRFSVVGMIDLEAAARTRTDGDVLLTVEALTSPDALAGGATGGHVEIDFAGAADGLESGTLSTTPQIAGRWVGSGVRRGRLTFTLRSDGDVAGGVLPLRFVLTAP